MKDYAITSVIVSALALGVWAVVTFWPQPKRVSYCESVPGALYCYDSDSDGVNYTDETDASRTAETALDIDVYREADLAIPVGACGECVGGKCWEIPCEEMQP